MPVSDEALKRTALYDRHVAVGARMVPFAGYEMPGWFGILAPPGVPAEITQKLRDEVAKAVAIPEVVKLLDSQGMQPLGTSPREWGDYLKSELATYSKMIKDGNLKPE